MYSFRPLSKSHVCLVQISSIKTSKKVVGSLKSLPVLKLTNDSYWSVNSVLEIVNYGVIGQKRSFRIVIWNNLVIFTI